MMSTSTTTGSLTRRLRLAALALALLLPAACQQQMANQPSYKPLAPNAFFPDNRSARPIVAGTVARGHLRNDAHLFTGKRRRPTATGVQPAVAAVGAATGGNILSATALAGTGGEEYVDTFPFPVTADVLREGRGRFMIYCVVCHDPLGTGRGKIVERGYTPPPSFHIDRLRAAPVGHFFDVVTNGYGSMPDYREQIAPRERWAIVAFVRALQLSQHFPEKELTADMRAAWDRQDAAPTGGPSR